MRICLISSYAPAASGIGTYSSYLVKELSKFAKVDVLSWNYRGYLAKLLSPIRNYKRLMQVMQSYDLVHIQYHLGDFLFLFLPVICLIRNNVKIVMTLHEDYTNLRFHFLISWFHNIFYHCADLLILHTTLQANVLSKSLLKKSKVIPHGVIYRKVTRKPVKDTVLLPGFINPWKGHDMAVKAFPLVLRRLPLAKLIIVGKAHDKSYVTRIKDMIIQMGLEKKIIIKDQFVPEEELFGMLQTCDIALLPYRRITMSGILCHVVSWNVPSVMSDLPVLREFTDNKGVYFPLENHKELAAKIVSLLKDKRLKELMSRAFQDLAKKYSWQNVAAKTFDQYKRLLQ